MKLVNKINFQFLLLLLMVFTFAGIIFYLAIKFVADENLEEMLESRTQRVMLTIQSTPNNERTKNSLDQSISIQEIRPAPIMKQYSDTTIFDSYENELMEFRKLTSVVKINEHYYRIQIVLSQLESEDMVELITSFMFGLFAFIVVVLLVFNRWLSSSWWRPFYHTIQQLKLFKIGQNKAVSFEQTNIEEFKELNSVLSGMIQRTIADFQNMKEFTENASHEIQTPLAIIKTKLEAVLQDDTLTPDCHVQIQSAFSAASRLSKLSEALLLISKIENRQFTEVEEVDFASLIQERVQFIEELLVMKNIDVEIHTDHPFVHKINTVLAETMLNNLLGNAIKHNFEEGKISIRISDHEMIFSNTGNPFTGDAEKIFQRFVKYSANGDSNGLGLAIVSEICKQNQLTLHYGYENGWHNFKILHEVEY